VRPGGGGNEACGEEINSSFYVIDPLRTCIVLSPSGPRTLRSTCLAIGSWDNAEQRLCHDNRLADKLLTLRIPAE